MSKVLIVKYLPREGSNTAKVLAGALAGLPEGTEVISHDLTEEHLPVLNKESHSALRDPEVPHDFKDKIEDYVEDIVEADAIIIAAPMYNFAVPASVKSWLDIVAQVGRTFKYTDKGPVGLSAAKNGLVIMTTGGTPLGGDMDFASTHLEASMKFLGVDQTGTVGAIGMNAMPAEEVEAAVAKAASEAEALVSSWGL